MFNRPLFPLKLGLVGRLRMADLSSPVDMMIAVSLLPIVRIVGLLYYFIDCFALKIAIVAHKRCFVTINEIRKIPIPRSFEVFMIV